MTTDELALDGSADAPGLARDFTEELLISAGLPDVVPSAQLVVTELVTNAMLHGAAPITLGIRPTASIVRIEVRDGSRHEPVRAAANDEAMTGRGLALVGALATRWGYELVADGKLVWVELGPTSDDEPTDAEIDELIDAWADAFEDERFVTVDLGEVPTDLLLSAKAHVDNVVREFTLAASGALTGSTAAVPPHLAELIDTVVHGFADARQAVKRQALAASAAGRRRTALTLRVPIDAAAVGESYLAALDEADTYARAARLLTLETPPQHRVFRRWYVESLIEQLRAIAAGETPTLSQTFEERLLEELGRVTARRVVAERAARLQGVTAALARATTVEEVASVVVNEGVAALDASGGTLLVPTDETHLSAPIVVGYGEDMAAILRNEPREADLPAAQAIRTGEPVWLGSREDRDETFPALRGLEPGTLSLCAVPLVVVGRVVGALRFSFSTPRLFDDTEREFVLALAAQTAQAVERSNLYEAERDAREAAELFAARLKRVAETVQHAILAPVPPKVGPVRLSARYVSAAEEALLGGDLYEVLARGSSTRLVIGDVRGKGLDAIRLATFVLGEFRGAALDEDDLVGVAAQMDRRLAPHLTEEEFVTAVVAEISEDGLCRVVSCGHPSPMLARDGQVSALAVESGLPLGLGASPTETTVALAPGDRLLFYTDGLVEARDASGRFADVEGIVRVVAHEDLDDMLDQLLAHLHGYVGADLGDDLALVVAEYVG